MNTLISYSNYNIAKCQLSVEEYVDRLSDDFIKEYGNLFSFGNLKRSDLASILKQTTGIKNICFDDKANEPEMLIDLFGKYLNDRNIPVGEIGCIIYTKGNPIANGVNIPYFIQKEYKIPDTLIFSIEQECSATLLAIKLASALIKDGLKGRVIILSSNFFESFEKRLMGLFIVSDAIGLMEVSKGNQGLSLTDFVSTSDGNINKVQDFTQKAAEVVRIGVKTIETLLLRNNLSMNDISLIIPQNTNSSGWSIYSKNLGIKNDQIYFRNFGGIGHLGDVDMIRNISDIKKENTLEKNQLAISYALGTGTSWNAALLKEL